jgi:hypothetical protein
VVDIEKILEKELKGNVKNNSNKTTENNKIINNRKEGVEKEIGSKVEHLVINKKIKIIKQLIKEKIVLITVSFSLIILILAIAFYLVYFKPINYLVQELPNQKEKTGNSLVGFGSNLTKEDRKGIKQEVNNTFHTFQNYTKEINENNNDLYLMNENLTSNEKDNYKQKIKELNEIVNEKCLNRSSDCLAKLAYEYKNPSFCLFSKKKSLCLQKYRSLLEPLNYKKAKNLIDRLVNGEISKEDLENEGITLEELASITGDDRICNFLKDPEQFSFCKYKKEEFTCNNSSTCNLY